jgi:ABC-type transporter Mla maintaining outer membrane lipid asymmetry ATPase subunit MlaF/ABC-type transporter Mla maintaining outer membrane lipid asymmetry permease subunit MlaE
MNAPVSSSSNAAAIELRDLSITAGGRPLLRNVTVRFRPGGITLIVGCSGVGKSLLLRVLAGLHRPSDAGVEVTGAVTIETGQSAESGDHQGRSASVGVVFQHFALFDEWSAVDNVRFAYAHRDRQRQPLRPLELLNELCVPPHTPTAVLSGGQRQRLAIARTLAYDPDVILYDEPTSGLDAATAAQVAELIRTTHSAHAKTSLIVTHDFHSLAPIADEIYLLDSHTQSLLAVPQDDWPDLREHLEPPVRDATPVLETNGATQQLARVGRTIGDFLVATTRAVEAAATIPWRLLPGWRSAAWGLRCLWHYLGLAAGPTAWIYIALAGAILGFVTTYFTFRFLPYSRYTEPLLLEDLLEATGFALYRILAPILITILIAARCGAAVASDVGGRAYGRQLDAFRTFRAPPKRYLLTNILYAFLIGAPGLVALGYLTSATVSAIVFTATHPEHGPDFWSLHFHHRLRDPAMWWYDGTSWLLAKTLLCALGIGSIAYYRGASTKNSARDVSLGVTSTVLWGTLYVLVIHFLFAFFEFEAYAPQ